VVAPPDLRASSQFLTVESIEPIAQTYWRTPTSTRLLLKAERNLDIAYGDEIRFSGHAEPPEAFNGFDYPGYLERYGIFTTVPRATVTVIARERASPLLAQLYRWRSWMEQQIGHYLPEPEASFLAGILLGSKRAIPSDVTDALRATGTSHLVAISGANITIVVSSLLRLLPVARARAKASLVISTGALNSILTGGSASVIRGAVVVSIGALVNCFGRRAWPAATILLAAVGMLLVNPLLIRSDPGFQLSFAAYAGLLIAGKPAQLPSLAGVIALPTWAVLHLALSIITVSSKITPP
jgi:competence protein ComEC